MKKVLGILALTLSVAGVANADQDVLKSININTDFRQRYTDKSGSDANGLGNEGFKSDNKERRRWRNEVSGTLGLKDEWDLDLNFLYRHDEDRWHKTSDKASTDLINAELVKPLQLGSIDTKTAFGWRHWTNKEGVNSKKYVGQSNEIYVGPTFDVNLLGQNISTTVQAVYFNQNGNGNQDGRYYKNGSQGAKEGWGANLDLAFGGNFYEGSIGKLGYDVDLAHYLRDASGHDNKSNVYLDYLVGVNYDTPSFGGFYAFVRPENEWYKHTAKSGYENEFNVWTGFGYKTSVDTGIGTININPSVRYSVVNKLSDKGNYWNGSEERTTTEKNELRVGLKVGLDVK